MLSTVLKHNLKQGVTQNYSFGGLRSKLGVWVLGIGNEGLGALLPAGSWGRAPGQGIIGQSPPEAETLLAFGHLMDTANLLCLLKFGNLKNQILRLFLPKKNF